MTSHHFAPCEPECDDAFGLCYFCHLSTCRTCMATEGGLPSECPEELMTADQMNEVFYRRLDFIGGEWVKL